MQLGVLYDTLISDAWNYAKSLGASAIHPLHTLVTHEVVSRSRECGILVRPYTVDDEDETQRLIHLGVDGIVTNEPDRVKKIVTEFGMP
jgi:glycerophosphoryl diester phosphodiesterase